MAQLRIRPQAEADLDEIWLYIARDNPLAADSFVDKIEQRCKALAEFPRLGVSRDELRPSLRSLTIDAYVVFYVEAEDGVEIIRVLQGMRDMEGLM